MLVGLSLSRTRFFYGWVIVLVMAIIGGLSMALGSLNFGLFIKPMGDDLGIGRATFGWSQTARQVASAVTAPLVGGLVDRFGARWLLPVAAVITGGAMVGLASIQAEWQLIVLFMIMGFVGLSGPGAIVTMVPVTKWFVHRRGVALAITSIGGPLGGLLFMPLTQLFIDTSGWRMAWIQLAVLGAGLIIPLAWLFIRRQPEDLGLRPDGQASMPSSTTASPGLVVDERSWSRAEAFRSSTFWRLVIVFSLSMLAISTVGFHRIPSFMDRGLDPRLIALATALDAAASGVSSFGMGMLARRIPVRFIGAAGLLALILGSLLTIRADNHPIMFASMILFGLGIGSVILMQGLLWADYFGRGHQGRIQGVVTPITLITGGIGAPAAGYMHDLTGSYTSIWLVAVALLVMSAVLLVLTPAPSSPSAAAPLREGPISNQPRSLR